MRPWISPGPAPLWLAQAQGAAPAPYEPVSWNSYTQGEAIVLAIVLLLAAAALAYAGRRLAIPLKLARPQGVAAVLMVVIWLLAIADVIVSVHVYGVQVRLAYPNFVPRRVRVGTFVDALATFLIILFLTRRWGLRIALASAFIGTAAAPMLFELPFDLIVMARTNPAIPGHATLYRQLFFLPLFLVEFSTVALLTLLPSMRVTASACYALAGMFAVFALWAAFGFAFPDEPLPLALNVVSKILCFAAAILLFVWTEDAGRQGGR